MTGYAVAVAACVVVVAVILGLLRTKRIREKYAGIWIPLALVNIVLVFAPGLATRLATLLGVATPVNLLFTSAFVVLLVVCVHLSAELSRIEDQARTLTEEVALLRLDLEEGLRRVTDGLAAEPGEGPSDRPSPESDAGGTMPRPGVPEA